MQARSDPDPAPAPQQGPGDRGEGRGRLLETIGALDRWGGARGWVGPDPYEGLNARRAGPLRRSALGRRLLIQAVKRSPIDLRGPLGIRPGLDPATLAHVLRAHARLPREVLPAGPDRPHGLIDRLLALRSGAFPEHCWGYHFDVQTRFFFYPRSTPNTIATAFAAHALLDARAADGSAELDEAALGAGRFFLRRIGLTEAADGGYFGYFPGDATPIHNASLLAASVLARLGTGPAAGSGEGEEMLAAARAAARFALAHQRDDGSWPYAEDARGDWVDGFHTGYVLDALAGCARAFTHGGGGERGVAALESARVRGLDYYRDRLLLADGAPRYLADSTYPIDSQCAAQAIRTFAVASAGERSRLDIAWRVYAYAVRRLRRRDGAFVFQRHRAWVNRIPHVRWVQAPMLEALSVLCAAADPGRDVERMAVGP